VRHEQYIEVSLDGAGVWVAVHGTGRAYLVNTVRLAQYSGTHRVTTVIDVGYPKLLSVLEPEATGQTLHATERDARRAAALDTPEAWLATEED
jgi:hypothetical protein